MKFSLSALLGLASLALAANEPNAVCPTATRTIQNRACGNECPFSDCTFHTTIQNPCGCPATLPTATLIAPCQAPCPYQGCDIDFRTSALPCPTTPTTTTRRTTTTPTSTRSGVVTSIVTLPPHTTTRPPTTSSIPCPKVTRTTSPDGCDPIRCPVPTCRVESDLVVPCGCEPKTVLYVTGCQTACSEGCLTRVRTSSLAC
ncbi:hypothetical protein CHGG_06598 [Chaetomium globosum CBS 148.51]|uniref:Uncharacterized protein n=1 Tax=Chaetomium globosum (strain ATCC 6205 / CBS 148.51 / DSM 1962 / NBRC 6347 / NRRL 1970) TaxID=306901 RepID=Q2H417_CHAGB|nr:uncharacterized protein CHGG_06598 [Chaetomium globosum CBS 148.51]EAQ89979.1 hypothetical protein CHGG_06598 [Chaetomium globosum CBS 148.51]